MKMRPKSIKKASSSGLLITWENGHESRFPLARLRDHCPCAGCKGETILLHAYQPPTSDRSTPGRETLTAVKQVGSYAVQLEWADGHDTGIYTWDYLLALCPCAEHGGAGGNMETDSLKER